MNGRGAVLLCAGQGDVASQHLSGVWLLGHSWFRAFSGLCLSCSPGSCSSTSFLVLFLLRGSVWAHLALPQDFSNPPDVLSCTPRVQAAMESPTLHQLPCLGFLVSGLDQFVGVFWWF